MQSIRKISLHFFALGAVLASHGCVGGTLGNSRDFEMFPLRSASESESKKLKRCLRFAQTMQQEHRQRTGHYARKLRDLSVDEACNGFLLAQKGTSSGYELQAELREEDTIVRWSINEKGVIEEHLDSADEDADLEF